MYKTRRENNLCEATYILFICVFFFLGVMLFWRKETPILLYLQIPIELSAICYFAYCITYDKKRKSYKKHGERIQGYIIGAEERIYGKGSNTFYLLISFDDNGKKIKYTEGYVGDPNYYLISRICSIYKCNGEYIEADFVTRGNFKDSSGLGIPITKYQKNSKKMCV